MNTTEMKDITEPLIESSNNSRFKHTPKKMASMCHTDASHPDPKDKEFTERLLGSKLVLEDFGGYDAIASSL